MLNDASESREMLQRLCTESRSPEIDLLSCLSLAVAGTCDPTAAKKQHIVSVVPTNTPDIYPRGKSMQSLTAKRKSRGLR